MTRRAIEVHPWPENFPVGAEHSVSAYPKPGIYIHPTNSLIYIVGTVTVVNVGASYETRNLVINIPDEFAEATLASSERGGLSEGNLLKLVAIMGKPELAEKLCL